MNDTVNVCSSCSSKSFDGEVKLPPLSQCDLCGRVSKIGGRNDVEGFPSVWCIEITSLDSTTLALVLSKLSEQSQLAQTGLAVGKTTNKNKGHK